MGGGGGVSRGQIFLGSFKKKHINPDFMLKNVGHNLQIWALLRA